MFKTIGSKVLTGMISGALAGAIVIYFVMTLGLEDLSNRTAKNTLTMLSDSIFQTLRLSMFTGDRAIIADTLSRAAQIDGVSSLAIAPDRGVIETFDLPVSYTRDADILEVFRSQKTLWIESSDGDERRVRLLKPLIAEAVCLQCHLLNQAGDVLGVMDLVISHKEGDRMIRTSQTQLGLFMAVAMVFAALGAVLFIRLFNHKLHAMQSGLLNFFAFLNQEKPTADRLSVESDDEFGQISKVINENIARIEAGLEKDRHFIGEATRVVGRVNAGHLDDRLRAAATTPALNELGLVINDMIDKLDSNIENILKVLKEYENDNYTALADADSLEGGLRDLIDGVNALGESIGRMLGANLRNGQTLENNAKALDGYVQNLSTASKEQAKALVETAGAVTEITTTIRHTAEKASRMARIAEETQSSAQNGNKLASDTQTAMDQIVSSANAINEAIAVIDTIAFQTNILSLNAAVEAATAGEAGKGFAVVAQEVRNLAGRSAEAARRIKELVEAAQQKAEQGKSISVDMMNGFAELSSKIEETSLLVADVAGASREQMNEIEHINEVVAKIEQMTQESTKAAAQTKKIAERTSAMAQTLVSEAKGKRFRGGEEAIFKLKSLIEQGPQGGFLS